MDPESGRFSGIQRLYGTKALQRLSTAHVCVVGIGGVGSWVVEALARSGVGEITLVDMDEICVTNVNRQIHALDTTVGMSKTRVMAERVHQIHPQCTVHDEMTFLTKDNAQEILQRPFDLVIDAIDSNRHKCVLISQCQILKRSVLTIGGAGGRRDPSQLITADLNRTKNDALLFSVRKRLRQEYAFPRGKQKWGIPCVYSTEMPVFPTADGETCDHTRPSSPMRLDCAEGYGSASFVTGSMAFMAVSVAIEMLLES